MPISRFLATNSSESVRPTATHSAGNWAATCFGAFGSGVWNPYYGTKGAMVWVCTGGHLSASNLGALIWSYDDNQFHFVACVNSGFTELNSTGAAADWSDASTSGAPYFELTGPTGPVPSPTHPYATAVAINVGTKGTILYLCRQSTCQQSDQSGGCHAFDCATGLYTRFTASVNDAFSSSQGNGVALYDVGDQKIYSLTTDFHNFQQLHYLDLAGGSNTFTTSANYSFPSTMTGGVAMLDTTNRIMVYHDSNANTLRSLDLGAVTSGWKNLTVTGALNNPNGTIWCFYPPDGKFYRFEDTGGLTLERLVVNHGAGTATVDAITLTGDTPPAYADGGNVTTEPFRSLVYAAFTGKMLWFSGNGTAITNDLQVTEIDPITVPPNTIRPQSMFAL